MSKATKAAIALVLIAALFTSLRWYSCGVLFVWLLKSQLRYALTGEHKKRDLPPGRRWQ